MAIMKTMQAGVRLHSPTRFNGGYEGPIEVTMFKLIVWIVALILVDSDWTLNRAR